MISRFIDYPINGLATRKQHLLPYFFGIQIDICNASRYCLHMIKSFADKETESFFCDGTSKKLPIGIQQRALRKLDMIDSAYRVEDLRVPPGNRLHALKGNRKGSFAISINDQWRICFRFEGEDAYDVEICDYH